MGGQIPTNKPLPTTKPRANAAAVRLLIVAATLTLGWCGMAGLAVAQVAAPSLTPFEFVTENPAAMQWGTPSRVGAAYEQAQEVTTPSSKTDNFEGYAGGFRFAGKYVSVAADASHFDNTNRPYNSGESRDAVEGALAVGLGRWLAIGVGQQSLQTQYVDPNSATTVNNTSQDVPQAGVSIRIAEWLFLGGAGGQGTGKVKEDATTGITTANFSDDVTKYGIGIRTGGAVLTHFEVYEIDTSKPKFSSTAGPGVAQLVASSVTQQTGVAELNFDGFLLSYRASHFARESGSPNTDEQTAAIGYAPVTGFTVVAIADQSTDSREPSGSTYNRVSTTTYSVAFTYLFDAVK